MPTSRLELLCLVFQLTVLKKETTFLRSPLGCFKYSLSIAIRTKWTGWIWFHYRFKVLRVLGHYLKHVKGLSIQFLFYVNFISLILLI